MIDWNIDMLCNITMRTLMALYCLSKKRTVVVL
jgi:hypothetical protein